MGLAEHIRSTARGPSSAMPIRAAGAGPEPGAGSKGSRVDEMAYGGGVAITAHGRRAAPASLTVGERREGGGGARRGLASQRR